MKEEVDDLKTYTVNFYKEHPFYIKYVWAGAISKKHQNRIKADNEWYQVVMGYKKQKSKIVYEPAPF